MEIDHNLEFRRIWEEMDRIEPLTPITTTIEDHDESIDGTSSNIHTPTP